jgi:hypothetical protein
MSNDGPALPRAASTGPAGGAPVQAQPPHMTAPPKKKGVSTGCLVLLGFVAFFFLAVGGVVLFLVYKVSSDKDVQNVMGAIGDAAEMAMEAQQAPGTDELRALGCEQAMAIDMSKMQKIGSRRGPDGDVSGRDVRDAACL